ncbi:MAG: RNA polymerase sigma factor [Bacteroidetes bacterium]|nr:RNA polymerase sigma factor [Bacteroidota bacterium]
MSALVSPDIINLCRKNDRKAQRQVYEKLFASSMRVCKRYCNGTEEAMEVLNTAFLKVFTQLDKYGGKGSFEGWVHRIMVNTSLDHLREEKKHHSHFIYPEKMDDVPDEETDELEYNDIELDSLYRMIGELPPVSRLVFNLYVFENFSHTEIGRELGISVGTSKWHLSFARKFLREKVKAVYQKAQ